MISDLDDTIRQVLVREGGIAPSQIDISFDTPNREWSAGISRPTINCYLFDIRENLKLKQQGQQLARQDDDRIVRRSTPLLYDLTYLVTAWTRAVEDEHRLLWRVLQTLVRFTVLPAGMLQGALREHPVAIHTSVARPDSVLKSPGEFWTALENQLKPSLSYTVILATERETIPAGPPLAMPPVVAVGTTGASPTRATDQLAASDDERQPIWFGGTIRDGAGAPLAGASIAIDGHGAAVRSDTAGRFRLQIDQPGRYTLVVQADGRSRRHEIDISFPRFDVTLE
jgi:hypothetical protein